MAADPVCVRSFKETKVEICVCVEQRIGVTQFRQRKKKQKNNTIKHTRKKRVSDLHKYIQGWRNSFVDDRIEYGHQPIDGEDFGSHQTSGIMQFLLLQRLETFVFVFPAFFGFDE